MAQLFDEVLRISLQFSNPNRADMLDAGKLTSSLSANFDSLVRKSLGTSRSVASVFKEIQRVQSAFGKVQDNPSKTGIDQKVAAHLQRTMQKYTVDRLDAMMQSVVARKEAFGGRNTAMADAFKKIEAQVKSTLESSGQRMSKTLAQGVGKVLILDTESTQKQVAELHARLVEYDRATGKRIRTVEDYTALTRFEDVRMRNAMRIDKEQANARARNEERAKVARQNRQLGQPVASSELRQYETVARGIPRQARWLGSKLPIASLVDSPGISNTRLRRMISQADFAVAHWPEPDLDRLQKTTGLDLSAPVRGSSKGGARATPWLDSSAIPWYAMGMPAKSQGVLTQVHNIRAKQLHRAKPDVEDLDKLLFSKHPQGIAESPNYLTMLRRQHFGAMGDEEKFLGTLVNFQPVDVKSGAKDFGGASASELKIKLRQAMKGSMSLAQTWTLQKQLADVQEFERNALIMPSRDMVQSYARQASQVEAKIGQRGLSKMDAGDVQIKLFQGVNAEMDRVRGPSAKYHGGVVPIIPDIGKYREQAQLENLLSNTALQTGRKFSSKDVSEFVRKHSAAPTKESGKLAAEMAASVGPGHPEFLSLTGIMQSGWGIARQEAAQAQVAAQRAQFRGLLGGGSSKVRPQRRPGEAGFLSGSLLTDIFETGPKAIWRGAKSVYSSLSGILGRGRTSQGIPSLDDLAKGNVLPPTGGSARQQIRYEALQAKLKKLEESVDVAAQGFVRLAQSAESKSVANANRVLTQRTQIAEQLLNKQMGFGRGIAQAQISLGDPGAGPGAPPTGAYAVAASRMLRLKKSKLWENATPTEKEVLVSAAQAPLVRAQQRLALAEEVADVGGARAKEAANRKTLAVDEKFAGQEKKLNEGVAAAKAKGSAKAEAAEEARVAANKKHLLQEQQSGEKPSVGGGQGSYMALMAIIAYDEALKALLTDSAVYAAKTQQMALATDQMATAAGISKQALSGQINELKNLNITTQQAYSVAQKMIMVNVDMAKSTGLVRVAQDLAAISGKDATEVVDRLMNAVLTGYTRNLHMLGLNVTSTGVMRELKQTRRAEGKKGEPSQGEVRDALVDRILLEGAKMAGTYERTMLTAGGQMAYLRKEMDEAKNMLGKEFLPAFGRAMHYATSGLKSIQENPGTASRVTSGLTSVGSGVTAAYATGILGSALGLAVPPMVRIPIALGAGLVTALFLTQDQADAVRASGVEALESLKGQNKKAFEELAQAENMPGGADRDKAITLATTRLQGLQQSKKSMRGDNLDTLVGIYAEKIKPYEEYQKYVAGGAGFIGRALKLPAGWDDATYGQQQDWVKQHGGRKFDSVAYQVDRIRKETSAPELGISDKDIEEGYRTYQRNQQAGFVPGSQLYNKVARNAEMFASAFNEAGAEIENIDKMLGPSGTTTIRAMKMYGSPEEKLKLEHDARMEKINAPIVAVKDIDQRMLAIQMGQTTVPDKAKALADLKSQRDENIKRIGGEGNYQELIRNAADENVKSLEVQQAGMEGLAKHTREQIILTRASADSDLIRSTVVQGDLASERDVVERAYQLQKRSIVEISKLKDSASEVATKTAQNEAEKQTQLAAIEQRRAQQARELNNEYQVSRGEVAARNVLTQRGLTSEEAITRAYDLRHFVASQMYKDSELAAKNQALDLQEESDFYDLKLDKEKQIADASTRTYEVQKKSVVEMSQILNPNRNTQEQQALGAIEQNRQLQLDLNRQAAEEQLKRTLTPGQVDDINQERKLKDLQANAEADVQVAAEKVRQRQTLTERTVETNNRRYTGQDRVRILDAVGGAEERAAEDENYKLRKKPIEQEHDLRVKYGEAEKTATKRANEEMLDVEQSHLETMMEQRKQYLEGIRAFSEQLFETATTGHAKGLRDMLLGKARTLGGTVFGNIVTMAMDKSKVGMSLPDSVLIDKNTGKPTTLGKILANTPFGKRVPSAAEIEAQKAVVARDAALVTNNNELDQLNKEIMDLIDALRGGRPGGGGPGGGVGATAGIPSTWDIGAMQLPGLGAPSWGGGTLTGFPGMPSTHAAWGVGGSSTWGDATVNNGGGSADDVQWASGGGSGGSAPSGQGPWGGIPGLPPGAGAPGGGGPPRPGLPPSVTIPAMQSVMSKYGPGAAMLAMGAYQAATNLGHGKGARGALMGIGGIATAGAGLAALLPALGLMTAIPGLGPALAVAGVGADLLGSMFQDPKTARSNQINNLLGMTQYLHPATLALTTSTRGDLVSENAFGATDSGIAASSIRVSPTMLAVEGQPPWYSMSSKPTLSVLPGQAAQAFGAQDLFGSLPTNQSYSYAQIPGQVLYSQLPGSATPAPMQVSLSINALDSQSILDRSPDIAAAVSKELMMGTGLGQSLQNAMFGPN